MTTETEHEKIMATIAKLNAETAKLIEEGQKYRSEAKYEWLKVIAYVIATFTAAFYLAFKVAGVI